VEIDEKKARSVSQIRQLIVQEERKRRGGIVGPIGSLEMPCLETELFPYSRSLVCQPSPLLCLKRLTFLRLGVTTTPDDETVEVVPLPLYAHLESLLSLRHFSGNVPLHYLHHLPPSIITLGVIHSKFKDEAPCSEWWGSLFQRSKLESLHFAWSSATDADDEIPEWWRTSTWLKQLCTSLTNLKELRLCYLPTGIDHDSCFSHLTALTKLDLSNSSPEFDHCVPLNLGSIQQLRHLVLERFTCVNAAESEHLLSPLLEQVTFFECDIKRDFFSGLYKQGILCPHLQTMKLVGFTNYCTSSLPYLASFRSLTHLRLQSLSAAVASDLPFLPELRRIDCCTQLKQTPVLDDDPLMIELKRHSPLLQSASRKT
jgi:hypothetical protein